MDFLIIAPTSGITRDPAQKEINDTIKDQTDAINLEQKLDSLIPEGTNKGPKDIETKTYHDMRPVRDSVPKQDDRARRIYFEKKKNQFVNGVSFPDMGQESNLKHWHGPILD